MHRYDTLRELFPYDRVMRYVKSNNGNFRHAHSHADNHAGTEVQNI